MGASRNWLPMPMSQFAQPLRSLRTGKVLDSASVKPIDEPKKDSSPFPAGKKFTKHRQKIDPKP